jgi:hypothetical protein
VAISVNTVDWQLIGEATARAGIPFSGRVKVKDKPDRLNLKKLYKTCDVGHDFNKK